MAYDLAEHVHRFSTWTAARAVNRGFTDTAHVRRALEASSLPSVVAGEPRLWPATPEAVDANQRIWAHQILDSFECEGVPNASYGLASKIISIYVKTSVVLRAPEHDFARLAHPPIDGVLLNALGADINVPTALRQVCKITRWTKLGEAEYFDLIDSLRECGLDRPGFWSLERYWKPERE